MQSLYLLLHQQFFTLLQYIFQSSIKRKIEEQYIRRWLQQLEIYGNWILEDIGGNVDCSLDKFKQKSCNIDLKSKPQGISMRELTPIDTWFEYFDNLFHWESIYMEQIVKYGDSVPSEILVEFEKYKQFDNLKIAVYTYNRYYEKNILYRTIGGFSHLAWTHAHSLMSLPELYIKHLYD